MREAVSALVVTGPVGVGKSAVLSAADVELVKSGRRHATVELDEIVRFWPPRAAGQPSRPLVYRNLAALWSNFAEADADRILLAGLIESRSDIRDIEDAIPNAAITVMQLRASLPVLENRVRRREFDPADELSGARWWFTHMERAPIGDHVVDTDGRSVRDVAVEVLRIAG